MVLPPQIYADVVSTIRQLEAAVQNNEARKAVRLNLQVTVSIRVIQEGKPSTNTIALMRDISNHGVGLLLGRPLAAGTRLLVQFPRSRGTPVAVLAECRFCKMVAEGVYTLGAEFRTVLADHIAQSVANGQLAVA